MTTKSEQRTEKVKKIVAKEFLILMGVIIVTMLTWLVVYLISTNTNNNYVSSTSSLRTEKLKLHDLERNNPNPTPKLFVPPSDCKFEKLPKLPKDVCLILLEFKPFDKAPNIQTNIDDFNQARQNLIEIHKAIVSTDDEKFYRENDDFNKFKSNLNKTLLTKIYNGITGHSQDYVQIYDVPKSFNKFLINIGYDSLTLKPLVNKQLKIYETNVENCKRKIITLQKEKSKIERSYFFNVEIKHFIFCLFIILLGITFPR